MSNTGSLLKNFYSLIVKKKKIKLQCIENQGY